MTTDRRVAEMPDTPEITDTPATAGTHEMAVPAAPVPARAVRDRDLVSQSPQTPQSRPGERLRRLRQRRKLLREELLAVLVLLLLLGVTVAVLVTQWLGSGQSTSALSHLLGSQLMSGGT